MKKSNNVLPILIGTLSAENSSTTDKSAAFPLILAQSIADQVERARKARVDWLELRLDTFFPQHDLPLVVLNVRQHWKGTLLLTLRSWKECGRRVPLSSRLSDKKREQIIISLLPFVDMVDIEIRAAELAKSITKAAHALDKKVILSVHDFCTAGHGKGLQALARKAIQFKADYFKVAVMPHSQKDLLDFLSTGMKLANNPLILIGMGKKGLASRIIGFSFGSVATYGYLGSQTAPGQLPAIKLRKMIDSIYGYHRTR